MATSIMKATLWDGKKRLEGRLTLGVDSLSFDIVDFEKSRLCLSILYDQIEQIKYHRLYDVAVNGIEITYEGGKQSVFVVDGVEEVMEKVRERVKVAMDDKNNK